MKTSKIYRLCTSTLKEMIAHQNALTQQFHIAVEVERVVASPQCKTISSPHVYAVFQSLFPGL